jgi:hypothetical protein
MPLTHTARVLLVLALTSLCGLAAAIDLPLRHLSLTYSTDRATCRAIAAALRNKPACWTYETNCGDMPSDAVRTKEIVFPALQETALNEYGYTRVGTLLAPREESTSVVYLDRFQGDKFPRILETWKVDTAELNKVFALPPGPLSREDWQRIWEDKTPLSPPPTQALHTEPFAALLGKGEKISDEWSRIVYLANERYAVIRECAGFWAYGAYYVCNRITKLTVSRLHQENKAQPVCEFSARRRR